ncbi:MAG TPA: alpha-xylosidase, partial [Caldilineae bacterium]|nr:alpha-xylosidase [Caldilineae bacterium]
MCQASEEYAEATFDNPNMTLGGLLAPWPWERGLQLVQQVTDWSLDGDTLRLQCITDGGEAASVAIQLWKPQVLRVRLIPPGVSARSDLGLLQGAPQPFDVEVQEQDGQLAFDTGAMWVTLDTRRWRLAIHEAEGHLICREHPEDTNLRGWLRALPLGYRRDEQERLSGSVESFYLTPDEKLYGLGERFMPLNRRGQRIELWNFNTWGASDERAYKNVPLLLSSRGYGLFFHTTHRLRFDLGSGHHSSLSTVVESDDPVMDFFVLYGPSLQDVLSHYADLTGRAPVPPRWSFGLWMSKASYETRQEVEEVARRLRAEDIPCDVIHLDPAWLRPRRQADLIWNKEAFSNPPEFLSRLRDQGFKVCLWIHPWVPRDSEVFPEAAERGYFARRPDGSIYYYAPTIPSDAPNPCGIVDFSHPEAVAWYQRLLRRLIDWGVAAFKTDFGEAIPEDAVFHNGMTGREMHNLYPVLYNRAVYEALEAARQGEAVVWARSAWAGSQRYPVHWSGDQRCNFPNMACTLWGGLSIGLSGIPFWSHDIGGFLGAPDPELYVRWAQFGLLCSHARCHGTTPREPWAFGTQALDAFRRMVHLRYRLIPYLYSYAHVASQYGLPVLRPMVLEFQDDPNTHTLDLQYMLGRELLVAPVFEPGT